MKNRDMLFQNYNAGGFADPNMMMQQQPMMQQPMPQMMQQPMMQQPMPQMMQPAGFNINSNYQAFGPNLVPEQMGYNSGYMESDYDQRITKCERQIRRLESRVSKLETNSNIIEENINENLFVL